MGMIILWSTIWYGMIGLLTHFLLKKETNQFYYKVWQAVITKCIKYCKEWQTITTKGAKYYKGWQIITKWVRYYKVWQLLQNETQRMSSWSSAIT